MSYRHVEMDILFENMENVCILSQLSSAKWIYSLSLWPCMKKQNSVDVGAHADLLYDLEIIENSYFPFFPEMFSSDTC